MAITQKPLEQRLGQILPGAAASTPAEDIQLEPMPGADQSAEPDMSAPAEAGTPSMEEGIQVAGPMTVLRNLVTKQAPKAQRNTSCGVSPSTCVVWAAVVNGLGHASCQRLCAG